MVMTVTLFAVGIFMGVIKDSGMVEAMAETIVNALPAAIAPHMHWFMALFSVPLLMILGTDAFYYALLPIIIFPAAPEPSPERVLPVLMLPGSGIFRRAMQGRGQGRSLFFLSGDSGNDLRGRGRSGR